MLYPGYSLRGTMRVERLDTLLDEDVKVAKVGAACGEDLSWGRRVRRNKFCGIVK